MPDLPNEDPDLAQARVFAAQLREEAAECSAALTQGARTNAEQSALLATRRQLHHMLAKLAARFPQLREPPTPNRPSDEHRVA